MLSNDDIIKIIQDGISDAEVLLDFDGCHHHATIISEQFTDKSLIQRQRLVYSTINDYLADGRIHAFSMKTHTPAEWDIKNNG